MIFKKYIIDEKNPSPYSADYFEGTYWHDIGDGISWRLHKHWGTGYLGAEGCEMLNGDKSGCIASYLDPIEKRVPLIMTPIVVEQRHYKKDEYLISAVFSYPSGIGANNNYFWEIYSIGKKQAFDDVLRFTDEKEMEDFIRITIK